MLPRDGDRRSLLVNGVQRVRDRDSDGDGEGDSDGEGPSGGSLKIWKVGP